MTQQRYVLIDTEQPDGWRGVLCRALWAIGSWFHSRSIRMHIDYSEYPEDWAGPTVWRLATAEQRAKRCLGN